MHPCLVILAAATCLASSPTFAQHAPTATAPVEALAEPTVDTHARDAAVPKPKSAFGRAMAELTRAARESKTAGGGQGIDDAAPSARGGKGKAASPAAIGKESKSVVATTESDDP